MVVEDVVNVERVVVEESSAVSSVVEDKVEGYTSVIEIGKVVVILEISCSVVLGVEVVAVDRVVELVLISGISSILGVEEDTVTTVVTWGTSCSVVLDVVVVVDDGAVDVVSS